MRPTPLINVLKHAIEIFNDKDKAMAWWMLKDPNLGNKSPYEICKEGRGYKIMRLLDSCIEV